ncbi:MAG TPA: hypothetical protein VHM70_26610 [Polyangiaceae bacterium]|nr:hypothetical protein [Polyangiaceae bacterium]
MFTSNMLDSVLSAVRYSTRHVIAKFLLSVGFLLCLTSEAFAFSVSVDSARIVDDHIEMVITTDVTYSCFVLKTTNGDVRSISTICVTGNQQAYSAPLSQFPDLRIGDTLYLQTVIAPVVQSQNFQFGGDLSLQSVRIIGGTQVEVVYTQRFPACSVMRNSSGTVISRTSSVFCSSGSNISVLLDRDLNFTNIQPGQSVTLGVIGRNDLTTNTVVVNSVGSSLPCVLSGSGLSLLDRAAIVASNVYSEDVIQLGQDVNVTGNLSGRDDARMDWRSKVTGNLTLIGTVTLERGSVTGLLRENTPVQQQLMQASAVAASTPNYQVGSYQTLSLPPGRYGNVSVASQGRLRLDGAGAYSFANLSFAPDTRLEVNTLSGDFNVEADDSMTFGDRFQMVSPSGVVDGSRVFLYTNSNSLVIPYDSVIRAQVWAPNANLLVRDRGVIHGCTRAHGISMGYDSRILQN